MVEHAGARCQVMSRDNWRGDFFLDYIDPHDFIETRLESHTPKSAKARLYQCMRQRAKPGPKRRKQIKTNHTMG
jgi:hypothetical protein